MMIGLVLEIKSNRQLEVKLHGTTLMRPLQGIKDLDIDLGPIEGTISWVLFPGLSKFIEGFSERTFCLVPKSVVSEFVLGPCRELKLEFEAEDAINMVKEVEDAKDFGHDLVGCTKDVSIILLEPANSG
jgi:hypothetical protein